MTPTPAFSAAIEQLKASLKQLPPRGKIEGCSEEDIRVIENAYKVTLPQTYKEFLLTMGRNCPYIFDEGFVHYPYMFWFRRNAKSDFADAGVKLGAKRFVFAEREGQYCFFDTDKGDDPHVFNLCDGEVLDTEMSFSQWIESRVTEETNCHLDEKEQLWEKYNSGAEDPRRREEWEQTAASPVHKGDVVRVTRDCKEVECSLKSKDITVKKGTTGVVYWTENYKGTISCHILVLDDGGTNIVSLPQIVDAHLEVVSSAARFMPNPTWEDYRNLE